MGLEINLKPEDVEALVRESIMKSGFGNAVMKALSTVLSTYNNPIENELRQYVTHVVRELLETQYGEQVRAAVEMTMRSRVTADILQKFTDTAIDKIVKAAEERY